MSKRTFLPFISSLLLTVLAGYNNVTAMPQSATDETKVPHYFGPYPNWANSPLTLPDARVTITGDGTGATAVATVGANGAITAIDVTDGGRGYGNAKVVISGSGTGASADATIIKKGAVVDIAIGNPGSGYTAPAVTLSGTGAAASAYGSVGNVTLANNGTGFTFPTVDFDLPDGPNGVQARGHADCLEAGCKPIVAPDGTVGTVMVTGVVVDNPGSGYWTAPGVTVRDGTIFDPIPKGAAPMQGSSTLLISSVVIDNSGSNYSKMDVAITDPTGTGATATASLDNGVISAINLKKPGWGLRDPGRPQEVRRHAARPWPGGGEQPRVVHPGRQIGHDDVRERRLLLRDRAGRVHGKDAQRPAADQAARLCSALEDCDRQDHHCQWADL